MKRTIYTKIVLSFVVTILLSTILSFFVTKLIYQNEMKNKIEQEKVEIGQNFIQLYKKENGNVSTSFLSQNPFLNYTFVIYDESLKKQIISSPTKLSIRKQDIVKILNSRETSLSIQNLKKTHGPFKELVGIPFQNDGKKYALIVIPHIKIAILKGVERLQIIQLVSVLLIGSLIFIYFSKKLVMPIRKLTAATKEIGKGNYRIEVTKISTDEIGVLTEHFNQMTKRLNKIEEMRQEFVASVSHEIQSPLTSIRGFAKALKDQDLNESDRISYLEIIDQESHRLAQLGGNLLKLASLDSEHHPFYLKSYYLDEQIRKVILSLQPQWEEKNLTFQLHLPKTIIEADEDLLEQAWMNILTNGIKYSLVNGEIAVSLKTINNQITFEIIDTGIGIPMEQQPYIFERFYKADHARTGKGSGLGLAITEKIISLHNGSISVRSEENKGSTFTVILNQDWVSKL